MKDYDLFVFGSWGFAGFVLILLFVFSWQMLRLAEKRHAEKA